MLMPTKHIKTENALIGIGAQILDELRYSKPVSTLFNDIQNKRKKNNLTTIHFDWFLLAIDFLYLIDAVRYEKGVLRKLNQ